MLSRSNTPNLYSYRLSKEMKTYKQYTIQEPYNGILPKVIRIEKIQRTDIIQNAKFILRIKDCEYWKHSQFTGLKQIYRSKLFFGDLNLNNSKSLIIVHFRKDEVIIIPFPGYFKSNHKTLKRIAQKLNSHLT